MEGGHMNPAITDAPVEEPEFGAGSDVELKNNSSRLLGPTRIIFLPEKKNLYFEPRPIFGM